MQLEDRAALEALFTARGTQVPDAYARVLRDPDVIPPWFRGDVYTDPAQIVALNAELRSSGYFHDAWPDEFIALGRDPGWFVYFTDTRDSELPVYLAGEDLSLTGNLRELDVAEHWGASMEQWLHVLAVRNAEIEQERPYAVFGAGHDELELLRAHPDEDALEALFHSRARPYCALDDERRSRIRAQLFDSMFNRLRAGDAFDLIAAATRTALRQDGACAFSAGLMMVAALADAANTSEVPPGLDARWAELTERVQHDGLADSDAWITLKRRYRR